MSSSMAEVVKLNTLIEAVKQLSVAVDRLSDRVSLLEQWADRQSPPVLPTLHLPKKEHAKQ